LEPNFTKNCIAINSRQWYFITVKFTHLRAPESLVQKKFGGWQGSFDILKDDLGR